jgi:hypothetical protein
MKRLAKAFLTWNHGGTEQKVKVQYNPTELSFEKSIQLAEISIPQLNQPLQQFIHGQAARLMVELFFDTTDASAEDKPVPVTEQTDKLYALTQTVPEDHAPPIVTFHYGKKGFPGSAIPEQFGSQRRQSFTGLVESVNQRFTLFSTDGVPLRATLNLTLREYVPLHDQFSRANPSSPERSHAHILRAREGLNDVAWQFYRRPDRWREIALANGIEDPRRIDPGLRLNVPKVR